MDLLLNGYGPYKWQEFENVYTVGVNVVADINLLRKIASAESFSEFTELVKLIRGSFSIIRKNIDCVWAAVDCARSFPLFYSNDCKYLSDRADDIIKMLQYDGEQVSINELFLAEMLSSRNTKNDTTVYNDIKQIDLGEAINFDSNIKKYKYYLHYSSHQKEMSHDERYLNFDKIIDTVFTDLLNDIKDKQIIVPLSGGYDSRFLLAILKCKNVKNVVCYTYGRINDYDVQTSKRVADELGYKWYFIPYDRKAWTNFWDDKNMDRVNYFEFVHNHCCVPHIQDYIALKGLKEQGVIHENCVILPGFCADLPAGSFVKDNKVGCSLDQLAKEIYNECYTNIVLKDQYRERAVNRIKDELKVYTNIEEVSAEERTHLFTCWFTGDRPSKWVVNSVRVYEYFGCEWRIPFWDTRFLNFFYELPSNLLLECDFYIGYIFDKYFTPLHIDIRKPQNKHLSKGDVPHNISSRIKDFIKKRMIDFSYITGLLIYNRNGVNNYNYACMCIYRKLLKYGVSRHKYGGVHQIEMIWWCAYKYGKKYIDLLVK